MAQLLIRANDDLLQAPQLAPDEQIRLLGSVGRLTINLLRAVSQTSVYRLDHQLTHDSIDDFMRVLESLRGHFAELTYVVSPDEATREISVEGFFVEPVPISRCLKGGLQDEFLDKLASFLQWNRVVSLSLMRDLTKEQFVSFLTHSARHGAEGAPDDSRPREGHKALQGQLIDSGVFAISVISRDEALFPGRQLPWRVKLALSRLRSDVRRIPLYANATKSEAQKIKAMLLQEIARPLGIGQLLVDFVVNCDLVHSAYAEFEEIDLDAELIAVLRAVQLRCVASGLIHELEHLPASTAEQRKSRRRPMRLLRHSLTALGEHLSDEALPVFEQVVQSGLIPRGELPEGAQSLLRVGELTDSFMEDPPGGLAKLETVGQLASARRLISTAGLVARGLIRRKEYRWAADVIDKLRAHAAAGGRASPEIRQHAQRAFEGVLARDTVDQLVGQLEDAPETQRPHVLRLFELLSHQTIPLLIHGLTEDVGDKRRRALLEALVATGDDAVPTIHAALSQSGHKAIVHRDLLSVLGDLTNAVGYHLAEGFLKSGDSEVRQAALTALGKIAGLSAQEELLQGLEDPELAVRAATVEQLGGLGCSAPVFLEFVEDLFAGKMRPTVDDMGKALFRGRLTAMRMGQLQLWAGGCGGVHRLVERSIIGSGAYEPRLVRLLHKKLNVWLLGGGAELVRERQRLIVKICEALGAVGTLGAIPVLRRARDSAPSEQVRAAAAQAIHDLRQQHGEPKREPWPRRALHKGREVVAKLLHKKPQP